MTAAHQREIARPITHRLRKFYRNDAIRPVVCQPDSLDFRSMLDEGKIFLAKLGGIPDIDAETLGALLVSKFQMAAMSRTELSPGAIAEYYLYIDEVQNFVMTSLPQMLSEAGKFGLRLVVANQFLRQLEGATLEAVMGNAGTTIMFALGPKDASALAPFVRAGSHLGRSGQSGSLPEHCQNADRRQDVTGLQSVDATAHEEGR